MINKIDKLPKLNKFSDTFKLEDNFFDQNNNEKEKILYLLNIIKNLKGDNILLAKNIGENLIERVDKLYGKYDKNLFDLYLNQFNIYKQLGLLGQSYDCLNNVLLIALKHNNYNSFE